MGGSCGYVFSIDCSIVAKFCCRTLKLKFGIQGVACRLIQLVDENRTAYTTYRIKSSKVTQWWIGGTGETDCITPIDRRERRQVICADSIVTRS